MGGIAIRAEKLGKRSRLGAANGRSNSLREASLTAERSRA